MEMTKERLAAYIHVKADLEETKYELEHLRDGDSMIGNDTIFDYRSGYGKPQSVIGFDDERYQNARARKEKRIADLSKECEEIEEFIDGIRDSELHRMFHMIFVEGITYEKAACKLHTCKSRVSKKISEYLKKETKETK